MISRDQIDRVLDRIRPLLRSEGGDIELVDVIGTTVRVRLTGRCAGCPSAYMTLHAGVERALRKEIAEVEQLVSV